MPRVRSLSISRCGSTPERAAINSESGLGSKTDDSSCLGAVHACLSEPNLLSRLSIRTGQMGRTLAKPSQNAASSRTLSSTGLQDQLTIGAPCLAVTIAVSARLESTALSGYDPRIKAVARHSDLSKMSHCG